MNITDSMVDRFLTWPLPDSVCADLCATKPGSPHRTGTNLLSAIETRQMLAHVLAIDDLGDMQAKIDKLTHENEELTRIFEMQEARIQEATEFWQRECGRPETWPDIGALIQWLMERVQIGHRVERETNP